MRFYIDTLSLFFCLRKISFAHDAIGCISDVLCCVI